VRASFAYVQVGGSLGKDPEQKSTSSGTKVVNFSVAVEQGFGENKSTGWHNIVCFKDVAEFAAKHLKKGTAVRILGSLQVRSWDDKETGKKRYVTEVVAHKIDFGSGDGFGGETQRATRQERAVPAPRQQAVPQTRAAAPVADEFIGDDDIPF
jgi:single-strand DNA-binding protein